ncbi:ninein-like protein isoform X1 [Falco peregrinus]|uniref:ninein-like protein isoform X1 n=1 Tax=Falco peregrinus TaxID=8954 RepID=UPI0024798D6F|nr:ninein-like protein isoform X1 [Falco peregrinus]XP_055667126.1 ninein-like protein isoform X1 [Falco peregrinus]XP_055667127.1 ninein-like protein isoform X1 [Falco peregrinus]XP_055667128.1 ninein-like protein isoform X1 [Falco peregrinus]XP_055667129.1 ninein-like protein isoform X1 [Falco peregrinus]XP_055667130.1 ninein-like protein isoform X1 [Falco peregrinus]XP_055667131.1 ninein-like protein isoform X1 [Falco peregrinus]XP_055667132.1 ninein-like protein isoform X1 [Falco peregri
MLRSSTEEQVSLAEQPAALDNTLAVPRSGLQHAAVTSYGYKLQCLRIQVRQMARERDKARLDLEKAERRCLQLGRELDKQYIALKHTQSKLKDFQAEIEAKELLLQQAVSHQAKLEADTQFLQGKEASLQGRLNHMMKENTQLQNRVTEMAEKLEASEKLVLGLQKELNHVVEVKLGQVEPHSPELLNQSGRFAEIVLDYERQCKVLWDQNGVLRRELERLRLQLQESRAERGLLAGVCRSPSPLVPASACTEMSLSMEQLQEQLQDLKAQLETKIKCYEEEIQIMRKNFERESKDSEERFQIEVHKMEDQRRDLKETVAKYWAVTDSLKEQKRLWSLEVEERFEMEQARVGQQHTEDACHPGQQLDQEGEELRMQRRDRESLSREELCQLKSQLERLQQELRLAKEKSSKHDERHMSEMCRENVEELAEIAELTASGEKSKGEVSHLNVRMHQLGGKFTEHKAGHSAGPATVHLRSQRLVEAEWLQGAEMAARLEHHQQHAACRMETELLQQQLRASQGKLLEAEGSLSLAQMRHALQLQQAKAQMNNMVPKKQFEQLQTSLREEQCKSQRLQENLHWQAEQTSRQLIRTQEEHERLLQAAVEQAEGLEHSLRSAEAVLADRVAQLKDAQAQLSRNKLLIEDLREENRGFAIALQEAELKQKSTEEKNQLLEEQASALKQLIGKITPASLSG